MHKTTDSKGRFILEMLDYSIKKNIDDNIKNRILALISKELEKPGAVEDEIMERLSKIEKTLENRQIVDTENTSKDEQTVGSKKTYTTPHSPLEMVKFLHKFSIEEKFKWFTHNPDNPMQEFDYKSYLAEAKKELPKAMSNKGMNYLTYSNVRNFLFENKQENGERYKCYYNNDEIIDYTWADMKDWCYENQSKHPYDAEIKDTTFSTYINKFKNAIEFRTDVPNLTFFKRIKTFIGDNLKKNSNDFTTNYTEDFNNFALSLNTYIDTNLLFRGLKQITEWIEKNKTKSTIVEFTLKEKEDYYLFEIFHKDSYFSFKHDSSKMSGLQGDFHKTRLNFFGVVDWEILAKFTDKKCFKIICLDSKTILTEKKTERKLSRIDKVEEIDDIAGVKHILKLYKTK